MLGLLAAGCSAGSHRAASTRGVASTPAHPPGALASDEGARTAGHLVVGTGVGADRVLQGVSFAFSPSVRRLIAGVNFVRVAAGSSATVTWSQEQADGEHTLFTQRVALRPQGVLYATAVAHAALAEGVFRVHATIGTDQRDALFVISRLAGARPGEGGSGGAPVVQEASREAAPGTLTGGVAEVVDGPDSCATLTDAESVRYCIQWYNDAAGAAAEASRPCPPDSLPLLSSTQDVGNRGAFMSIRTIESGSCKVAASLTLAASVNGASPAVVGNGQGPITWFGETCGLPGHSDLVGDVVHSRLSVEGSNRSVSSDTELGEFGPFPVGRGTPPEGTEVAAGQRIEFTAAGGVVDATRGIKSLVVRAQDGTEVARAGRAQPAAACDLAAGRFMVIVSGSYTVPSPAPPVVELTVSAQTFDGPVVGIPLRWYTQPTWTGALEVRTKRVYRAAGLSGRCTDTWKGHLRFVVDAKGAVGGTGELDKSGASDCTLPSSPPPQIDRFAFVVGGSGDAKQITIHFERQTALPKGLGTFGGIETLFRTKACAQDPGGGPPIPLELSSPTSAAGAVHLSALLGCGGSARDVFTSDSTVQLTLGAPDG
jgi:hypothetical protein